jgi:hypothetical protein
MTPTALDRSSLEGSCWFGRDGQEGLPDDIDQITAHRGGHVLPNPGGRGLRVWC